jgi:hypothetical protein
LKREKKGSSSVGKKKENTLLQCSMQTSQESHFTAPPIKEIPLIHIARRLQIFELLAEYEQLAEGIM